jgi:hypothetical protein
MQIRKQALRATRPARRRKVHRRRRSNFS